MIFRASLLLAAALCGPLRAARADEPRRPPQAGEQPRQGNPLSAEDAEVVRQLALLEQVELLRNLDLFEPQPSGAQQATQHPDAGTREP
ncbi:MAG TPA: hypothetical protein VF994_13390 [Myxococcales bacterium]